MAHFLNTGGVRKVGSENLKQQFIVDYYCRIIGDKLKLIREQQGNLKVDTYIGLANALSSTFIDQDATAIVRKFGKTDIFITSTKNQSWTKISNSINSFESLSNKPDMFFMQK